MSVGWSGGRNKMYFAARRRSHNYLYYIFMDDDVELQYNSYTPKELIDRKFPPLQIFTEFLLDDRPAAAGTDHDYTTADDTLNAWHRRCKRFITPKVIPMYEFDACFNAFHRDTVNYLLPYFDKYDTKSFWLSQIHLCFTFQLVFYGQYAYFPYIRARNPAHRYTKKGHLKDMAIRRDIVENVRERTSLEYRNHSRFQGMIDFRHVGDYVMCEDPPPRRAPIIPYSKMEKSTLY